MKIKPIFQELIIISVIGIVLIGAFLFVTTLINKNFNTNVRNGIYVSIKRYEKLEKIKSDKENQILSDTVNIIGKDTVKNIIRIDTVKIIYKVPTSLNIDQIIEHNYELINTLNQWSAFLTENILNLKSNITQGRIMYFMILAAIIAFLLSPLIKPNTSNSEPCKKDTGKTGSKDTEKTGNDETGKNGYKVYIYILICIIIMLAYGLEILMQDLITKPTIKRELVRSAIKEIFKDSIQENLMYVTTWPNYAVKKDTLGTDFKTVSTNIFEKFDNDCRERKWRRARHPDLFQAIYYFSPLIGFLVILIYKLLFKKVTLS